MRNVFMEKDECNEGPHNTTENISTYIYSYVKRITNI